MKKSLLALAVLSTFAGIASAQTSLTVYGLVDAGVVSETGGSGGTVTKLTSGVQSGSRLGFRGTEDLGSGLTAKFVLETGIAVDTGGFNQGNTAFGRQAYVGLGGTWGALTLGRQYTPLYLIQANIADPFGAGLAGNINNLVPDTGTRMNNTIKYTSPDVSGFNGEIAYGFGEVPGNSAAGRAIGASVGYANGPAKASLGYHTVRNATDTGSARNTFLAGSWDFNVAKAHLAYGFNKGTGSSPYRVGAAATPFGLPAGPGSDDSRDLLLGVTVPFGASTFLASYIRKDDKSAFNNDARQLAIGYTYALSKRTNFYTSYARIHNDNTAAYTVGSAIEAGSGDKAFNLGVRHTF